MPTTCCADISDIHIFIVRYRNSNSDKKKAVENIALLWGILIHSHDFINQTVLLSPLTLFLIPTYAAQKQLKCPSCNKNYVRAFSKG